MSLREVLIGMIEEYARHMGHATWVTDPEGNRIELWQPA